MSQMTPDGLAKPKVKRKKNIFQRAKASKGAQRAGSILFPIILGVVIVILWQSGALHRILRTDTYTLPLLTKIISIMADNRAEIMANVASTVKVAAIGLGLGSVLGYAVAILAACRPKFGKGGLSVVGAFASIPVVALAPVMTNWTKDVSSDASVRSCVAKIIVVMLIAAANMCLNAYRGLTELPPYAQDLMKTYAAKKRVTLLKLRIPNSIPYVFIAWKVAVPASIMTTIVSEYFAEYITGVGRQIRENIVLAQYSTAWAYIATACIVGIIAYIILMVAQSIVMRRYQH